MITINIKDTEDEYIDGMLTCKERTTNEKIRIMLPTLGEDGVKIYKDGKIEIGGPRPPIEYYTEHPPKTDEITINISGWFYLRYKLIIKEYSNYTLIQCLTIDNPRI